MSKFPRPGVYPQIQPRDYFSVGINAEDLSASVLSKSMLWRFHKNAWRWRECPEVKTTAAMLHGSLVDCLLLTPGRFPHEYAATPETYSAPESKKKDAPIVEKPWNWNAGPCKEWKAEMEGKGIEVLKYGELETAMQAVERLKAHRDVAAMLAGAATQTAVVGELPHKAGPVLVKGLLDIVPDKGGEFGNALVDLKTTGQMESPRELGTTIARMGYHVQAALYLDLWNAVTGDNREEFWFVFQLAAEPYEVCVAQLEPDAVMVGRKLYLDAVDHWKRCVATGEWDSPFHNLESLNLPEWAYNSAA